MALNFDPKVVNRAVDRVGVEDGYSAATMQNILSSLFFLISGYYDALKRFPYSDGWYPETLDITVPADKTEYEAIYDRLVTDDLSALGTPEWVVAGGVLNQARTDLQWLMNKLAKLA